jgi:hypothetical protein
MIVEFNGVWKNEQGEIIKFGLCNGDIYDLEYSSGKSEKVAIDIIDNKLAFLKHIDKPERLLINILNTSCFMLNDSRYIKIDNYE